MRGRVARQRTGSHVTSLLHDWVKYYTQDISRPVSYQGKYLDYTANLSPMWQWQYIILILRALRILLEDPDQYMILRTLLEDPETMEAPGYDLSSQHSCISSILQRNRQTLEKTTLRSTSKFRSKSYHRVAHWKFGRGSPTSPVTMMHFHCLCEVKSRDETEAGIYIIWVTFLWRGQLFDRCH